MRLAKKQASRANQLNTPVKAKLFALDDSNSPQMNSL